MRKGSAAVAFFVLVAVAGASDADAADALALDGECNSGDCALNALQLRSTHSQDSEDFERMGMVGMVKKMEGLCPEGMVPGPPMTDYCWQHKCPGPKAVFYSMAPCSSFAGCSIDDYLRRKYYSNYYRPVGPPGGPPAPTRSNYYDYSMRLLEEAEAAETGTGASEASDSAVIEDAVEAQNFTACPQSLPYLADGRCFRNRCIPNSKTTTIYTMAVNCNFYTSCVRIPPGGLRGFPVPQMVPQCDAHMACVNAGLSGDCCPSVDGKMLGCCS